MTILFINLDRFGFPRVGVMCLVSALKQKGHTVALAHACDGLDAVAKCFSEFKPDIVGYSLMTGEHAKILEFNQELKARFTFLSVFGGPHPTFFPSFINEDGCDAVCVGEGDYAFPEFCQRVASGGNYWETPNFLVRYQGQVFTNELMPLVANLDDLPAPDRETLYAEDAYLRDEPSKSFMATRGCPYKCTYCFNNMYNTLYRGKGKIVRGRSPQRVVDEILEVKAKYPLSQVGFLDDSFLSQSPGWFDSFCELYKRKIGLPFTCNVRANMVREAVLTKLKDAGLTTVWMGVECGDEDIANDVLKRQLSNEQILKAARIIKKLGIKLVTQNLIGLPVANSYEADLKTLDLNINLQPDFAWSSILYPYPGTPIAEHAAANGFLCPGTQGFLETNKRYSSLKFSPEEKVRIEHLHKLFGVIVNFPWLRRFVKPLTGLPLSGFYRFVFYAWYGYCIKVKTNSDASVLKEVVRNAGLFMRMLRKG